MPSDVIMTRLLIKFKKFVFVYKSIEKMEFWLKFLPKTHFAQDFFAKYERDKRFNYI